MIHFILRSCEKGEAALHLLPALSSKLIAIGESFSFGTKLLSDSSSSKKVVEGVAHSFYDKGHTKGEELLSNNYKEHCFDKLF